MTDLPAPNRVQDTENAKRTGEQYLIALGQDPTLPGNRVEALRGTLGIQLSGGSARLFQKLDDGLTSNWMEFAGKETAPEVIAPILAGNPSKTKSVTRLGSLAAVALAQSNGGFQLFDVFRPYAPRVLGRGASSWSVNKCVFLSSTRLLALVDSNTAAVESWDITVQASPVKNQSIGVAGSNKFYDMDVSGNLLAVADVNTGVHFFNITNPLAITFISTIAIAGAGNVRIRGTKLYVTDKTAKAIKIYNISNPLLPVLISTKVITGSTLPLGLEVSTDEAYVFAYEDNAATIYPFTNVGGVLTQQTKIVIENGTMDAQGSSGMFIDSSRDVFYVMSYYGIFIYRLSTRDLLKVWYPDAATIRGSTCGINGLINGYMLLAERASDRLLMIRDPLTMA